MYLKNWQKKIFVFIYLLLFFSVPGSIAGMELAFFLLLIFTVFCSLTGVKFNQSILSNKFWFIGIALLAIYGLSSFAHTGNYQDIIIDMGRMKFILLGYLVNLSFRFVSEEIFRLRYLFYVHLFWVSCFGVFQGYEGYVLKNWNWELQNPNGIRSQGFFSNTMTYSYVFAMWFAYFIGGQSFLKRIRLRNLVLLCSNLVVGFSLVLTYTRGMWLGLIISLGTGALIRYKGKTRILQFFSVSSVLMYLFSLSDEVRKRFVSVFDMNNVSNSIRLELWETHIKIIVDNFLIGVGSNRKISFLSDFYKSYPGEHNFVSHAHNNYLEVFSTTGILGFFVYCLFFGYLFFHTLRIMTSADNIRQKSIAFGGVLAQILFHIGGITECTILDQEIIYSFILIVMLAIGLSTKSRFLRSI